MADRPSGRWSSSRARSADGPPRLSVPRNLQGDLALELLGVLDGFAPQSQAGHDRSTAPSHVPAGGLSSVEPLSHDPSPNPALQTSDQHGGGSPFALRSNDLTNDSLLRRAPSIVTASTISNDTTSSFIISRTVSPFQGPSRPTHPYAMYPQGTGFPSPVTGVASTVRLPDRAFIGAGGPAHPYGMYPQNTVPEGVDSGDSTPVLQIPVGFPGLGQNYQRRLGPEGEEAGDIIGPDGHTEQLPPYTRYPDGIPPKGHIVSASEGSSSGALYAGPGAPEYDPRRSQVSVGIQQSRLSVRSVMSDSSQAQLNAVGTSGSDTNGNLKEKLAERGKRKMCRGKIPLWWIAVIILLSAFLVGGITGGLFARHRERERLPSEPQPTVFATVTTTLDASPIPTRPPYIPPLPTGTWVVSVNTVDSSNDCLRNPSELNAWSCIPTSNFQDLQIEITSNVSDGFGSIRVISTGDSPRPKYGAQAPVFDTPEDIQMAIDIYDPDRGPAYFFHLMYDKVVILRETELASSQSPSKRGIGEDYERRDQDDDLTSIGGSDPPLGLPSQGNNWGMSRKTKPGDMVWVCVWNKTLLEGFIYITQSSGNSSPASPTNSAATSASTSPTSSPNSIPMPYPYVLKIEERRVPASQTQPEPYCQKMKIKADGRSTEPIRNSMGDLIIDTLDECKPWTKLRRRLANRGLWRLRGRDDHYPTCRCEWMNS
ncbi:MAG: hypothetical protein M1840_001169 [Geoglossum simile]|nr:MAG: hypothetical protein M1840_001169 [Geoglossum simile]